MRRVTGGGAVYHDLGNLNYTIVGSSDDLERDYPEYTRYMLQALQKLGIPATMSGRNDILVEGRKVSGFAKRVCKNRLMIHGTLMFDVNAHGDVALPNFFIGVRLAIGILCYASNHTCPKAFF